MTEGQVEVEELARKTKEWPGRIKEYVVLGE